MYSPLHPDTALIRTQLEPGLDAFKCPKSGGHWIPLESYFIWQERSVSQTLPLPSDYEPQPAAAAFQRALLCPESGCLLVRYRAGHGLNFYIDRSPKTGGVWLDPGEWDALKSKGLHDELHLIFSAPYQKRLREELSNAQLQERFRQRIGEEDFERVKDFKAWLEQNPKRRDIIAYLLDGDAG